MRWLSAFVDDLALAPVALVGNCMCSLTALHYAAATPANVRALVLMNTLDKEDVGAAGPMGGGSGLLRLAGARWFVEQLFVHAPTRWWERPSGRLNETASAYPHLQLGSIPTPRDHVYRAHALELFGQPSTRANLIKLGASGDPTFPPPERLRGLPPTCWIWGEANQLLPYEVGKRQVDVLHPEEVHVLAGGGYAPAWEAPDEVNAIIGSFLQRHPAGTASAAGSRS